MRTLIVALIFGVHSAAAAAPQVTLELEIPRLHASPYHRPFVAAWLEDDQRRGVHTLAVWYDKDDWLKDLRQWWRKQGRTGPRQFDGVTGATRRPGQHRIQWNGLDAKGTPLPPGEYYLNLEAVREAGGREHIRHKIRWPQTPPHSLQLQGSSELGTITVRIHD